MTRTLIIPSLCLFLAACGGSEAEKSTTTQLDTVEVEPGSISDSMIILDNVAEDGTPAEPSEGAEGADSEDKGDAAAEADAAAESSENAEAEDGTAE